MNFEEVCKELKAGKKIRKKSWPKERFVQFKPAFGGLLADETGCYTELVIKRYEFTQDVWEIYKEPNKVVKGVEAVIKELETGKYKYAIVELPYFITTKERKVSLSTNKDLCTLNNGHCEALFVNKSVVFADYELIPKEDV